MISINKCQTTIHPLTTKICKYWKGLTPQVTNGIFYKKTLKTLWPLFMDGVQLPQGYSHFEEAVYFLPLSSQKFVVLILSTLERWKAESTFRWNSSKLPKLSMFQYENSKCFSNDLYGTYIQTDKETYREADILLFREDLYFLFFLTISEYCRGKYRQKKILSFPGICFKSFDFFCLGYLNLIHIPPQYWNKISHQSIAISMLFCCSKEIIEVNVWDCGKHLWRNLA